MPMRAPISRGRTIRASPSPPMADTPGPTAQDPCTAPIGETLVARSHSDLWLFCAGEPSAGQQLKQIFRSADQGRHWNGMVNHHLTFDPGLFPGSGYLNDVEVVSATTAWVALYRGGVWSTRDGGHAWTEAPFGG